MSGAFPISNSKFSTMGIKSIQKTLISKSDSGKKLARQIDSQRFAFTAQLITAKRSDSSSNSATVTIEPPLTTALADNSVVTYDNVPFTVYLTSDIQEFGVVGSDKDGNLLYSFQFDVEEAL